MFWHILYSNAILQVLSFIHKPTFDPTAAPVTLILAIASIGARFTNLRGAASFANVIAKLNRRLLLSMVNRYN